MNHHTSPVRPPAPFSLGNGYPLFWGTGSERPFYLGFRLQIEGKKVRFWADDDDEYVADISSPFYGEQAAITIDVVVLAQSCCFRSEEEECVVADILCIDPNATKIADPAHDVIS